MILIARLGGHCDDTIVPQPENPQNLNRYSYCGSNPLRFIDPSGHAGVDFGGGGGGGAGVGLIVALMQGAQQTMTQAQGAAYQYGPVAAEIIWLYGNQTIAAGNQVSQAVQNASQAGNTAGSGGRDPNNWGPKQEQIVRQSLTRDYRQDYGVSDAEIRQSLGIQGKVADFVGYNSQQGRWLIAESKGSDIDGAVSQLSNTMNGVLQRTGVAASAVELRIYMSASQYQRLLADNIGGWRVQDGYLGWLDDIGQWYWANVNGIRILVEQAPQ